MPSRAAWCCPPTGSRTHGYVGRRPGLATPALVTGPANRPEWGRQPRHRRPWLCVKTRVRFIATRPRGDTVGHPASSLPSTEATEPPHRQVRLPGPESLPHPPALSASRDLWASHFRPAHRAGLAARTKHHADSTLAIGLRPLSPVRKPRLAAAARGQRWPQAEHRDGGLRKQSRGPRAPSSRGHLRPALWVPKTTPRQQR